MKNIFLFVGIFFFSVLSAQFDNINPGEVIGFRIHYGFITAGNATLSTTKTSYKGQSAFYVRGVGKTSGAAKAFFKVEDVYESYISDKKEPLFYVRNVSEGSYTQHLQSTFNTYNNTLVLVDKKHTDRPAKTVKVPNDVQDILSCFYYLRSVDNLKVGSVLKMSVWIDDELFPFQLRVAGTEKINTKFGKINCLKIIPSVISGRVFKDKEGVTMWVTNDQNRVPVLIKAELAVGSLKASIDTYSNVKYPIKFEK
ncbi:DUF3108 domain-containing protein [Epilithonimonas ginsengisoli]|uniref:DUF3108 domain-containing protein n=1 Tax=Epilithonimonas ginsengisoli TaxID=1245592 RepID=A0ABU4JDY7_9FLAO|nr:MULTISPECIES: DUF3108 domain-containing protein [Chryseobacterium group]MBV6879027.1 DUF3108 domain-containing protein [Epilithonimonas sp. FP105]MDW8547875.1 DUF3108 domain-containing protein [Epilithonimonas ginsengisoli]OAH74935.1 ATP-dependent exonuclease [Chryseobacterium sp. FP211-J200]